MMRFCCPRPRDIAHRNDFVDCELDAVIDLLTDTGVTDASIRDRAPISADSCERKRGRALMTTSGVSFGIRKAMNGRNVWSPNRYASNEK